MDKVSRAFAIFALILSAAMLVLIATGTFLPWLAPLVAVAFALWAVNLSHDYTVIRWLLWNVRCQRGRRCANMVFTGPPEGLPEEFEVPPGTIVTMDYQCGACGSVYHTSAIINGDTYTQTDRERIA